MEDIKLFLRYDPLLHFLLRITHGKTILLILISFSICGIGCFFFGGIFVYFSWTSQILGPFQATTWPIEFYIYILTLPTVWVYYAKETQYASAVFSGLLTNKVLYPSEVKIYPDMKDFLKKQEEHLWNRWYPFIALGCTIAIFSLWWSVVFTPNNPFWFSKSQVWWQINPFFFWGIWVPVVWGTVYMFWCTFFRRVATVRLLNRLLKHFTLSPRLFHPDQTNGFSPIGKYPLSFTFLVIMAGGWVFLVIAYPVFFGHPANLKVDTYIYIILYIILTSAGLFAPIWKIHKKMLESKNRTLEVVAEEIRKLLEKLPSSLQNFTGSPFLIGPSRENSSSMIFHQPLAPKDLIENIEALKNTYELIKRELHTWPFNLSSISQFLITFGFPFFIAAITTVPSIIPLLGR